MRDSVAGQVLWRERYAPRPHWGTLADPVSAKVLVIGGGFTGLSTALHLRELGVETMLLEAGDIACAASGRNGGQVVPGLKTDPDVLLRRYGRARTAMMHKFAFSAADYVFDLIERLNIDCSYTRNGWIQAAVSPAIARHLAARTKALNDRGGNVEYLSRSAMREATGSDIYCGGLNEKDAGAVQPLKFAIGLAENAVRAGAVLYEQSAVSSMRQKDDRWEVEANGVLISATNVVLATDAYTATLCVPLSRSVLMVGSAQIATEPLPEATLKALLPWRAGVSEAKKIPYYYRIDPEGRFLIGGRGPQSDAIDPASLRRLQRAAVARFPALANAPWEYGWAGKVSLTLDDAPRLSNPAPGLWTAYGYSGRGVALAVRMGRTLANAVARAGEQPDYPVTETRPLFWHRMRQPAVRAAMTWYRAREALGFPV